MPRQLKNLRINDVSSVDRGAGRGVRVALIKRDAAQTDTRKAAEEDANTKDDDVVIDFNAAREAVRNAVERNAIEKATDFDGAVEAIEVGEDAQDLMREVNEAFCALSMSVCSILDDGSVEDKQAAISESLAQFKSHLAGLGLGEATEKVMTTLNPAVQKQIDDAVTAAVAKAVEGKDAELAKAREEIEIAKLGDKHKAYHDSLNDDAAKKKFRELSADEKDASIDRAKKRAEDDPIYKRVTAENEDLKKRLQALEDDKLLAVCKSDAKDLGLTAENAGEVLMKVRKGEKDAVEEWTKMLASLATNVTKQLEEARRTGKIFGEFGKAGGPAQESGATALDQLNAKARELRKSDSKLTEAQAFEKVLLDPANRELAEQEKNERMSKIYRAA